MRGWSSIRKEDPTDANGPPELQGWISERNCDLKNALEFSDSDTVAKVGSLLCQGTARFMAGSPYALVDGSTRSSLIQESDAKKEGGARASASASPSMVGNQMWDLLRISRSASGGSTGRQDVSSSDDDVLTSLEHELTFDRPFITKWIHNQMDALEQDLMSHKFPNCEARSQSSTIVANQ